MANVRLIGGTHAGTFVAHDIDRRGPRIELAEKETFRGVTAPSNAAVESYVRRTELYHIHELRMPHCSRHFGILEGVALEDGLDEMWRGYQRSVQHGDK